ncbi:hypothetical protein [Nostoc sp.]
MSIIITLRIKPISLNPKDRWVYVRSLGFETIATAWIKWDNLDDIR